MAYSLEDRHLAASSRDCGSDMDDHFWTPEKTTDEGMNNYK